MRKVLSAVLVLAMLIGIICIFPVTTEAGLVKNKISQYEVGDIIEFGYYPQSRVTDKETIDALYLMYQEVNFDWKSYGWYDNGKVSDYAKYTDVVYKGNKYRGILYQNFRPYFAFNSASTYSEVFANGIECNALLWYKYEPIEWVVLDPAKGLVMSSAILDSQEYNTFSNERFIEEQFIKADNYEYSTIRTWLCETFATTAFSESQLESMKNTTISIPITGSTVSDKVFLLSKSDIENTAYNMTTAASRQKTGTDYAKSQGLHVDSSTGYSYWTLQGDNGNEFATYIDEKGEFYLYYAVPYTAFGVVPAFSFNPNAEIVQTTICSKTGNYHDKSLVSDTKNATCTTGGYTKLVCNDCGETVKATLTLALGHSYTTQIVQERTFTQGGIVNYKCSVCDDKYTERTTPFEHYAKGDLNGDDKQNAIDSNLMSKIVLGSIATNVQNIEAGDLNSDGKINPIDVNLLKKAILGQIVLIPTYNGPVIEEGASVEYHTTDQLNYINNKRVANVALFANGTSEKSRPNAITLDFSEDDLVDSCSYVVEYSSTKDFKNSVIVNDLEEPEYDFYNPLSGQDIYYRGATNTASLIASPIHHLTVSSVLPRNCYVDGVTNVRDIGGYNSTLVENGKIRQGLFYRGANLNTISTEGKAEMYDHLGIRCEIDLRDSYQCLGPYIDGVEYNAIPIPSGTEPTRFEEFADEYYKIFTLISNADKKPVYLHCTAGADRTGISCFMLLTVCGAEYNDIARDYLFTNFSTHGARSLSSEFNNWWLKLDNFEGETKAEKAKSWLLSKGIEEEKIEKIRSIFVEGYVSK